MMGTPGRGPLRPTCSRCRARKVRCDRQLPRCRPCEQADVDCVVSGAGSSSSYDRQYVVLLQERVFKLQQKEAEMKAQLERRKGGRDGQTVNYGVVEQTSTISLDPSPGESTVSANDHGMGFINLIFSKIRNDVVKSRVTSTWSQFQDRTTTTHTPGVAGSVELTESLFQTYIRRSISRYPYLDLTDIEALLNKLLGRMAQPDSLTPEDSFRAYAIMATGAVYRNQELITGSLEGHENDLLDPVDLFSVALQDIGKVNLLHGITGVQNLLLITRFRLFHPIGSSLWDLASLNMRVCQGCGFHLKPLARLPAFEEQMQRRVFWQCYGIDRYASTTLGRPVSIPDEAITVELPVNVDDTALKKAASLFPNSSLNELVEAKLLPGLNSVTSMSLGISHIQLRRITSHAFRDFSRLRQRLASVPSATSSDTSFEMLSMKGEVWSIYYQYLDELHDWRLRSRAPTHGESSVLDGGNFLSDSRWIELHFYQEKLFIIRLSTKSNTPDTSSCFIDPIDMIEDLYDAASNVVILYSQVAGDAKVEPTPGRLYRVLTAGLSILYTIVIETQPREEDELPGSSQEQGRERMPLDRQQLRAKASILALCTETLRRMATQVVGQQLTPKYVGYFELLCREVLRTVPTGRETSNEQCLQDSFPARSDRLEALPNLCQTEVPNPPEGTLASSGADYFHLPCPFLQEHEQPCFCATYGDAGTGMMNLGLETWFDSTSPSMVLDNETFDPSLLVMQWDDLAIWDAFFGGS